MKSSRLFNLFGSSRIWVLRHDVAQLVGAKLWDGISPRIDRLHCQAQLICDSLDAAEVLDDVFRFHDAD